MDKEVEPPKAEQPAAAAWWRRPWARWAGLAIGVIGLGLVTIAILTGGSKQTTDNSSPTFNYSNNGQRQIAESEAIKEGKLLSNNQCQGEGVPRKLSASPMQPQEFSIVIPYGLMVGGHVTPIDHQYFSPKDYQSKPDAYEVRAMADSQLVDITTRPRPFGQEYRLVFAVSCTFLYYYDLVTSLSPDIDKIYQEAIADPSAKKPLNIAVKAGQRIGRIGGQTLDFAVWDTTKPLSGFIVPEHYTAERWKMFTADPLKYYTDDLKTFILSRYVRTAPPISGKIDYDQDGRLIGNWFVENTNGYQGDRQAVGGAYWRTHLSFSPNLYATDWFVISIGDYEDQRPGEGSQFITPANTPQPQDVSPQTGLVKYDLSFWNYLNQNGTVWDQNSLTTTITVQPFGQSRGCALVHMLETRKLRFEAFKGKSCAAVSNFSSAAKLYTR